MGFVKKLKDILFEEEEEITVPQKEIEEKEEPKIVKIEAIQPGKKEFESDSFVDKEFNEPSKEVKEQKEEYGLDNSFQFPDFDEEEFVTNMSRQRNNANVLDYERKKTSEKKTEYTKYERVESKEYRDYNEKKKFKPSPIISPVYGILNQDYKSEDIVNRTDTSSNISIEEVRKKAFEPSPEVIDEPVVTFFEDKGESNKESSTDNEDFKSIDDLLEQASDEINLEDTLEVPSESNLGAIEDELEKLEDENKAKNKEKDKGKELEDTLDNDLFELIDSMYDNREEDN